MLYRLSYSHRSIGTGEISRKFGGGSPWQSGVTSERVARWGALILLSALPFAIDPRLDTPGAGQLHFLRVGAAALLAVVCALRLARKATGPWVPFDLPLVAASAEAACALFSSALAPNPAYALGGMLLPLAGLALFVLLRHGYGGGALRVFGFAVLLQTLLLSLYGVAQSAGIELLPYSGPLGKSRVIATLGHPNFLGSFLAPAVFVCAALATVVRRPVSTLAVGAAVLGAFTMVLARSRAAGLGLVAGLVVSAGLLILRSRSPNRRRLRHTAIAGVGLTCLGLGIAAVGALPVFRMPATLEPRLFYWKVAAELAPASSPLGIGTGGFSQRFWEEVDRQQRVPEGRLFWRSLASLKGDSLSRDPGDVHNDYLRIRVEWGWGALFAHLLLLLYAGVFTAAAVLGGRASATQALLLGGLVASAVDSLFGFPLELPCSLALFWLLVALLTASGVPGEARLDPDLPPAPRRTLAAAVPALLIGLGAAGVLAGGLASWRGDLLAEELVRAGGALELPAYRDQMQASLRLNPAATSRVLDFAVSLGRRGADEETLEPLAESLRRDAPIEAFFLKAALQAEKGQIEDAIRSFERVHRVAPEYRPAAQYLLGLYAGSHRTRDLARLAREMERRWPASFDALVALGNAALEAGDLNAGTRWKRLALEAATRSEDQGLARVLPAVYDPAAERAALDQLRRTRRAGGGR